MESSSCKILKAAGRIIQQIREDQQDLLKIAEDQERAILREVIYDLGQADTLITRAISR